MTMTLNWKARGDGRYDALASRIVGGNYFIEWIERYFSDAYGRWYDVRGFDVHYYQTKGGGGRCNVSLTDIQTLAEAKALAETDHAKRKALIRQYGSADNIPRTAWHQFACEMRECQERGEPARKEGATMLGRMLVSAEAK